MFGVYLKDLLVIAFSILITHLVESYQPDSVLGMPQVFCKKGILRNFAKFTGKHLCQSHFFNKIAGLRLDFAYGLATKLTRIIVARGF